MQKESKIWISFVVQQVKDLVLSLQWLRSLLWCRFSPWPRNSTGRGHSAPPPKKEKKHYPFCNYATWCQHKKLFFWNLVFAQPLNVSISGLSLRAKQRFSCCFCKWTLKKCIKNRQGQTSWLELPYVMTLFNIFLSLQLDCFFRSLQSVGLE